MKGRVAAVFLIAVFLFAPMPGVQAQEKGRKAPLFEGMGGHHQEVTTSSRLAQRYFDQGLILAYGFNFPEAHRSFMQAAELDPGCAMAWWGAAWVLGPNVNGKMDTEDVPKAWRLLQKAGEAVSGITDRERAYIEALGKRYGPEPLEDRSSRDLAFARAMGEVAGKYPDDLDAQVIYAESLMVTTPWDYWLKGGKPKKVTSIILATLKDVLHRAPEHPMANHLMIHTVEAAYPLQGLEEAKRLEDLVPGAGHLVHMPSHIYIRLGRYHDATLANQRAIEADRRYLEQVDTQGSYRLGYVPHNYHFAWFTASLEGRRELAGDLARQMAGLIDGEAMRKRSLTTLQHYYVTPLYDLVRFGRWDDILAYAGPAEDLVYPRAVWHYARGMAFMRKGRLVDAIREKQRLDTLRKDPDLKWVTVWDVNKSRHILEIASLTLNGEIAAAAGHYETAADILQDAVKREDELNYDEPPAWHFPTRQALGAVLLQADKMSEAEAVYRQDLLLFPENGWSLYGLMEALRRQGRTGEADEVQRRFREAWRHADVVLTSSKF